MKKVFSCIICTLTIFSLATQSKAGDMKYPLMLTYIGGMGDINELYLDNLRINGLEDETNFYIPLGLSFHPFYEFDYGLRLGGGIGPFMLVYMSIKTIYGSSSTTNSKYYFDIPVNVNIGYTLIPPSPVSPYIKAGFIYHINSGDYLESTSPGLYIAGGLDFLRNKRINFGLEVAMDLSEATFEDRTREEYDIETGRYEYLKKNIRTGGLLIGIFIRF